MARRKDNTLQSATDAKEGLARGIPDRREQNLVNVRRRLEKLAGRIGEAVWICSADWKKLEYAGPGFESVWGIGAVELKKDPLIWLNLVEENERDSVRRAVRKFNPRCANELTLPNFRINWPEDRGRLVSICLFAIDWEDSEPRVAMVCRDVTELDDVHRAWQESNKKLREVFNELSDAIFIVSMDGRFLQVNDTACLQLGYSREELLKMGQLDINPPEMKSRLGDLHETLEREGRLLIESSHRNRNGDWIPVEISSKIIEYNGVPAMLAVARDITGRKQREMQLRAQNEMIQAVFDKIPVMIVQHDIKAGKFDVNQEFTRKLGWTNEDAAASNLLELCLPDLTYRCKAEQYIQEGSTRWLDFELTARDGSRSRSSWSNVALSDGTSIAIGIDMEEHLAEERAIEALVESTAGSTGQRLFDKVTANICAWLDTDGSIIGLIEGVNLKGVSVLLDGEYHQNVILKLNDLASHEVLEKEFVHIERDFYKLYPNQEMYQRIEAQGYIGVLLRDKNSKAVGVMATISRNELPLATRTEKILRVIAARIGSELDRINSDEALANESRINKLLADLARQLIRMEDLESISRLVLDHALLLTNSSQGFAGYVDPQDGRLVCPRVVTAVRRWRKQPPRAFDFGDNRGLWGWVLDNRQPLMVNDTPSDPRYAGRKGGDPIGERRFYGYPATTGEQILGILAVADSDWDYTERDGFILERLSAIYAISIQRCRSQNELRKLSEAVAQSPNSILISDPAGTIEFVNPRYCEISGYEPAELLGRNLRQFQAENGQRKLYSDLWNSVNKGRVWKGELLNRKKNDEPLWELVSIAPLKDAGGKISHLIEIKEDISLIKQAEQVLQKAHDELELRVRERTLSLEKANRDLREEIERRKKSELALSVEQKKLEVMLKHERLVAEVAGGFNSATTFEESLQSVLGELSATMDLESVTIWQIDRLAGLARHFYTYNTLVDNACETKGDFRRQDLPEFFDQICRGEFAITNPEQSGSGLSGYFNYCRQCYSLSCPLEAGGRVKGLIDFTRCGSNVWSEQEINVFHAVSEIITNAWERHNEVQARLAAERHQTESVQMVERATRLASIGVIAAGITHEINQPLNAIRLTADGSLLWLERNQVDLPDKFIERLRKISSHVERITKIIKHMRRFWAQREGVETEIYDLREAVTDALGMIEQQLSSHGIRLVKAFADEPITLIGDRLHMEQIVINLTVNAMQILDSQRSDDPGIEIRTRLDGDEGVLEVEDNGPGFQIEDTGRLFEMFYTTKKSGEGSGLGLAIVKRYTEELGGTVSASTRADGSGALFTIRLPLADTRAVQIPANPVV